MGVWRRVAALASSSSSSVSAEKEQKEERCSTKIVVPARSSDGVRRAGAMLPTSGGEGPPPSPVGLLLRDYPEIFVESVVVRFLSPPDAANALAACRGPAGMAEAAWRRMAMRMQHRFGDAPAAAIAQRGPRREEEVRPDRTSRHWKREVRREYYMRKQFHGGPFTHRINADVTSIAAMSNETFVAVHCNLNDTTGSVILWDANTGERLRCFRNGGGAPPKVTEIVTKLNERRFVGCSGDGTAWLWDVNRREPLQTFSPVGQDDDDEGLGYHRRPQNMAALSKLSENEFVTLNNVGVCRLWDTRTGKTCARRTALHRRGGSPVTSLAVVSSSCAGGGGQFVTGDLGGNVSFWDMGTGKCVRSCGASSSAGTAVAALTPFGSSTILSLSSRGELRQWDTSTYRCIQGTEMNFQAREMVDLDGTRILCGGNTDLKCWDAGRGEVIYETCVPHPICSMSVLNEATAILGHCRSDSISTPLHGARLWKAPRFLFER